MVSCSSCGISKVRKNIEKGISWHRFPSNQVQRKKWVQFVGEKKLNLGARYVYLCSQHFDENSFDKCASRGIKLKKNSIPTILVRRLKYEMKFADIEVEPDIDPLLQTVENEDFDEEKVSINNIKSEPDFDPFQLLEHRNIKQETMDNIKFEPGLDLSPCAENENFSQGEIMDRRCREIILNVYNFTRRESLNRKLMIPLENFLERTLNATGISKSTLERIVNEEYMSGHVS